MERNSPTSGRAPVSSVWDGHNENSVPSPSSRISKNPAADSPSSRSPQSISHLESSSRNESTMSWNSSPIGHRLDIGRFSEHEHDPGGLSKTAESDQNSGHSRTIQSADDSKVILAKESSQRIEESKSSLEVNPKSL